MHKIKNKASSGPDNIILRFFRMAAPHVIKSLTFLVNISLQSGRYPEALKVSFLKIKLLVL